MKDNEVTLLLKFVKVRKEVKETPNEKLFISFFEKLNSQPYVLHELSTFLRSE